MGAHPERVLLRTTAGLAALSAGVVLDLAGLAWTLALTRRALSMRPGT
jgi:tight adherence protein B